MNRWIHLSAATAMALSLAGCYSPDPGVNAANGAFLGAGTGALIGAAATGKPGGALIGGVIGALSGATIGAASTPPPGYYGPGPYYDGPPPGPGYDGPGPYYDGPPPGPGYDGPQASAEPRRCKKADYDYNGNKICRAYY